MAGGPELNLTFYAPQPGFVRLFAQVQISGISKFAPFGIRVSPAPSAAGARRIGLRAFGSASTERAVNFLHWWRD